MTCIPRHFRSITVTVTLLCLVLPVRAEAHLPTIGLGPVYDGIFHLLLSPEDLIPVIALALLAGRRGAESSRRVLWILPLAWFAGGFTGMFLGIARGSAWTCFSFLLLGGLIAANAKLSVPLITALAALLGFLHGYLNGSGINRFNDGAYALLGLALAIFVVVALFTSFVIPLRRQWALIVVRVAGSWIAASGLLMLGWALH
jgi:hydrogenase/urease accessory protein HupE